MYVAYFIQITLFYLYTAFSILYKYCFTIDHGSIGRSVGGAHDGTWVGGARDGTWATGPGFRPAREGKLFGRCCDHRLYRLTATHTGTRYLAGLRYARASGNTIGKHAYVLYSTATTVE